MTAQKPEQRDPWALHIPADGYPTDRDRTRWLLAFVQRDLADTHPGDLIGIHAYAGMFCRMSGSKTVPTAYTELAGQPLPEYADGMRTLFERVQETLRSGLNRLQAGETWSVQDQGPGLELRVSRKGKLIKSYVGELSPVFLQTSAELLYLFFADLRRCARDDCSAWFLPRHGRQKYHHEKCSRKVRWKRYAPKRSKRDHTTENAERALKDMKGEE